jgi:hypothetical protein
MIALIAASLILQAPAPVKQPGTHELFYRTTMAVEEKLAAGDFQAAQRLLLALPKREVVVQWDDKNVPANSKAEFAAARDAVLNELNKNLLNVTIKVGAKGQVKVTFEPTLPVSSESGLPSGAVHFYSPDPGEPQVEAVIALKRGNPSVAAESVDVFNETAHALMAYFGVGRSPIPEFMSSRTDVPTLSRNRLQPFEQVFIRNNLLIVDSLAQAVNQRKTLAVSSPKLTVDTKVIELPETVQGTVVPFALQFTNLGSGLLAMRARPDCGCVTVDPALTVDPEGTALLKGQIDTTEFVGDLHKTIFVMTNDPNQPAFAVPVKIKVRPLYRLVLPKGNVVMADGERTVAEAYLWSAPGVDLKPEKAQITGLQGTVAIQPWSGVMADTEMGELELPRKGYRLTIVTERPPMDGRFGLALLVQTNSEQFPLLRLYYSVQTGIVAMPGSIYFGEIQQVPRRATFLVTRPNKPFKITDVQCDLPFVKGTASVIKEGTEYRISVQLDGKQPAGTFNGIVSVLTDDPKQPKVNIPIQGVVR